MPNFKPDLQTRLATSDFTGRLKRASYRLTQLMTTKRIAATLTLLAPIGIAAHYAKELYVARRDTPTLISQAWQRYGHGITLSDLSKNEKLLLIAVEDPAFYYHHGVDLNTPGAGMTTITQALVKLLYFPDGFNKGVAKIRQTLIARYALDPLISKNEQLELLLNIAYLGSKDGQAVRGFTAAASAYFNKPFDTLSETEFQSLVAMLVAPDRLIPGTQDHALRMRRIGDYLTGKYRPTGVLDVEYDGNSRESIGQRGLMALLRFIT